MIKALVVQRWQQKPSKGEVRHHSADSAACACASASATLKDDQIHESQELDLLEHTLHVYLYVLNIFCLFLYQSGQKSLHKAVIVANVFVR